MNVRGPPLLYFEPQHLNFDFISGPGLDPAFHSCVDLDPASKNNANPRIAQNRTAAFVGLAAAFLIHFISNKPCAFLNSSSKKNPDN